MTAPATGATNLLVAALGDLDKDGKLDLVVVGFIPGNSSAGTYNVANVYTFLGNGDGTFQAAKTLPLLGVDGQPNSIALGDFNNDGKMDVVIGNPSDYTEVLVGNGDGTFTDGLPALGQRPATVAAGDLNGDGFSELLVGQPNTNVQGNTLAVFNNQAIWTATSTATTPTVTVTPLPLSITTAQSLSVTIGVSGGSGAATGSVTLASGAYTSASTPLASGCAIITVPAGALALGTDTLTATYTPDTAGSAVYTSATGTNSVTVTAAPSFTLGNGGAINIAAGATTGNTSTITVTPLQWIHQHRQSLLRDHHRSRRRRQSRNLRRHSPRSTSPAPAR